MLDIPLRPLKDSLFNPLSRSIPSTITPTHITLTALLCGLISCIFASTGSTIPSLTFWLLNRALDCLDGAVARHRNKASDLGGFLDLLCDFVVYAFIPISVVTGNVVTDVSTSERSKWEFAIVAALEASFYLNNFVLFYIAALIEKKNAAGLKREKEEVTSLAMRPALVEGFESGVFFTVMLGWPAGVGWVAGVMFVGVVFGTAQRVRWLAMALGGTKKE